MTRAYVRPHDRRRARGAAARRAPATAATRGEAATFHGDAAASRGDARRASAGKAGRPARRGVPRAAGAASPRRVLTARVQVDGRTPRLVVRRRGAVVLRADLGRLRAPARRARVSATASRFSGTYATVAGKRRAHAVDATRAVLRFAAGERLELAVADDGVAFQHHRVRLAGGPLPAGRRRARLAAAADQGLRGQVPGGRARRRARARSATRRCSPTAATPTRC